MKIFDFLVKIAVLGHLSYFLEIRVMRYCCNRTCDTGRNAWRKSPPKKRDARKTAFLTKKSKIFIKAKLTVSKSCLQGHLNFMIFSNTFQVSWGRVYRKSKSGILSWPNRENWLWPYFSKYRIFWSTCWKWNSVWSQKRRGTKRWRICRTRFAIFFHKMD